MVPEQQPPLKMVPDRRPRPVERRRSVRAECQVPVVVRWVGAQGSRKEESTETRIVNAHGCLVFLKAMMIEGTKVEVMNCDTKEVRRGHVAWCGGVEIDRRSQAAIELEDPDPKFWGHRYIDFLLWTVLHSHELQKE